MAGKRKAEGIALLSVYAGDDDDDGASQASGDNDYDVTPERQEEGEKEVSGPPSVSISRFEIHSTSTLVLRTFTSTAVAAGVSTTSATGRTFSTGGGMSIVDYAQDEGLNLSPEAEDGEIIGSERMDDDSGPLLENGQR